jgi:hypothetical protein
MNVVRASPTTGGAVVLCCSLLLALLAPATDGPGSDVCAGAVRVPATGHGPAARDVRDAPAAPSPWAADGGGPLIDILIVYTPAAQAAAGGTGAVTALVAGYVDSANQIYADSGVAHRLRLVHSAELAYVESGNLITDLARLKAPAEGHMDGVHALRDAFGADCVSLVTTEASAGTGYLMEAVSPAFEDSAFSALGADILGHVLAHEVGHNMGLNHNNPRGPAGAPAAFCHSFGYRTPDEAWRSVMSSAPGAQAFLFSSPALEVGGFPFGVAGAGCPGDAADAVASMAATDDVVAAFRPTVVPRDAFLDLGHGLAGTHGVPVLHGAGAMVAPDPVTLTLSGALENTTAALIVGFTELGAPFKGGTLVPQVDLLIAGLPTGGAGSAELSAPWPAGLPAGFSTWFQFWISDPAGPAGLAASNGVQGTTP